MEGRVARSRFEVKKSLGPDSSRPGKVVVMREGAKRSRAARTEIEVEERFRRHTLVRVRPRTGRGHQIRVHLQSIGHPIVGDVAYGSSGPLLLSSFKPDYKQRRGVTETPVLARTFLHAERIAVPMPDGEASLCACAPLPDDLARALRQLRRFAGTDARGDA